MKFSIKHFFSKFEQIPSFLLICSHLLIYLFIYLFIYFLLTHNNIQLMCALLHKNSSFQKWNAS